MERRTSGNSAGVHPLPTLDAWPASRIASSTIFAVARSAPFRTPDPDTRRFAEGVARMLGKPRRMRYETSPTPLTGQNRGAGRGGVRRVLRREAAIRSVSSPKLCRQCGNEVGSRQYCDVCLASQAVSDTGLRKAAARVRVQEGLARWREQGGGRRDPESFQKEILPLREVSLSQLMEATGLSEPYCSRIRRGRVVPHVRHWQALEALAD